MKIERTEHWIPVEGGIGLHSSVLRRSDLTESAPAITVAAGFGGLAETGMMEYAEHFAERGFVTIIHDHRGFGRSGGWPRQDIDPWRQIFDWRRVITYLQDLPGVDPERIGLMGSSYAGGHALVLAGSDPRIKAVVAQIPTISGYEQGKRRNPSPEAKQELQQRFNDDERAQMRGVEPERNLLVSTDPDVPAVYRDPAIIVFEQKFPLWENARYDRKVTLRSTLKAQMFDPGVWIERIAPTPLLMIVGTKDTVTPFDLATAAYERAGEPKKLITYDGGHFEAYIEYFDQTAGGAGDWFVQHLNPTATN